MKTIPNVSKPLNHGLSRTGMLVMLSVLAAVSVIAFLGFKLRAAKSQLLQPVQLANAAGTEIYQDPNHNFTLAIPADWTVSASPAQGPGAMTLISFQNPNGTGFSSLAVWKHPQSSTLSARKWAEEEVAAGARMGKKDGAVRSDSWSDLTVAGRPATSVITDFVQEPETFTIYHVYAMTDASSLKFRFMIPAGEFGELKLAVDAILASCKLD